MLTGDPTGTFVRRRTLSLAVLVTDASDGRTVTDEVTVSLVGDPRPPLSHRAGYALFLDRGDGEVTVSVDGGDEYQDTDETVDLDALVPTEPVVEIPLTPR